jgi:hypothetical protein
LLTHAQNYPAKPIPSSFPTRPARAALWSRIVQNTVDAWGVNVIADNRPAPAVSAPRCAQRRRRLRDVHGRACGRRVEAGAGRGLRFAQGFSHVTLVATVPMLLLVHPALPVKSRELIALAKRRPGALNCASSGGGAGHLAMDLRSSRRVSTSR